MTIELAIRTALSLTALALWIVRQKLGNNVEASMF
jgi:hypothetical protein